MVLRITKKLAAKLNVEIMPEPGSDTTGHLDEWYGKLFTFNRTQYILFTNAQSMYSVIIYGKGITDPYKLVHATLDALTEVLKSDGYEDILNAIVQSTGTIEAGKTVSRQVLGVMNEMIFTAKYFLADEPGISLFELSKKLNDLLFTINSEYRYPKEIIKDLLVK